MYRYGHVRLRTGVEPFRECIEQLYLSLAAAKRRRPLPPGPRLGPFSVVCEKCGLYPASQLIPEDGRGRPVCDPCFLRLKASPSARRGLSRGVAPESFEEIGASAAPLSYLALTYIDVDRLGEYMVRNGYGSFDAYKVLSELIDQALVQSITAGFASLTGLKAKWESLLEGGDDAMVAVPAGRFDEFLRVFASRFAEQFPPGGRLSAPTYSVGAAIAHSHYPITEFRRLAKELLRSAKSVKGENSIDYEVVTTSMTGSVTEARDRSAENSGCHRTAKPYRLTEWFRFCDEVRKIKKELPASQIKALYAIAYQSKLQAEMDFAYMLARLGSSEHRCLVRNALAPPGEAGLPGVPADLQELSRESLSLIWRRDDRSGRVFTRAADLVELWDFLP